MFMAARSRFVLPGYEGSAHDGAVLNRAMRTVRGAMRIPAGFYYLADCGYRLALWLLTPYRGYHLKEGRCWTEVCWAL